MRIAALDLGSNTSLLLVVDIEKGRIQNIVHDELNVTRMGQGVHQNRKLHPEALERIDKCFEEYAKTIRDSKVDHVLAMATSAARDVTNAEELFKIGRKHGIEIEIIPGAKEAEITFKGSTFEEAETKGLCVIDVGGGSTEIIGCEDGQTL
ncbi:MAG: Ppx/GppA family phosphatase, partial [Bdellovibrionota bacterium]